MKHIASCSFGKDSLAAILCRIEYGEPVEGAVYCRIMFDDDTSAELPEHEEWIHTHAIPLLKSRYGIETAIVQAKMTYCDCFYRRYQRGGKVGRIYGFPFLKGPWCNSRLKIRPMAAWAKAHGGCEQIVGIASDEEERVQRDTVNGNVLPLVDHGVTEAQAFDLCRKADLLSPGYNGSRCRLGCWFCHNQRIGELKRLRKEYPRLWGKLMALDRDSPVMFKPENTLKHYNDRFWNEEAQLSMFDI